MSWRQRQRDWMGRHPWRGALLAAVAALVGYLGGTLVVGSVASWSAAVVVAIAFGLGALAGGYSIRRRPARRAEFERHIQNERLRRDQTR